MSEAIDKQAVERAICEADGYAYIGPSDHYGRMADAAIGAVLEQLMEPTEAMLEAGRPRMNSFLRSADTVWRVMLRAASPPPA